MVCSVYLSDGTDMNNFKHAIEKASLPVDANSAAEGGSPHRTDTPSLPTLTREERNEVRHVMEKALRRSGTHAAGPISDAIDSVQECVQGIVDGTLETRKQRILEENSPAPQQSGTKSKGGQPGNRNAVKHNLTSTNFCLIEGESLETYEAVLQSFIDLYQPKSAHERLLVETIANGEWRLHRAARLESAGVAYRVAKQESEGQAAFRDDLDKSLLHYSRYESNLRLTVKRAKEALKEYRSAAVPAASSCVSNRLPAGQAEITKSKRSVDPGESNESGRVPLGTQSSSSAPDVQRTSEEITKRIDHQNPQNPLPQSDQAPTSEKVGDGGRGPALSEAEWEGDGGSCSTPTTNTPNIGITKRITDAETNPESRLKLAGQAD